MPSFECSDVFLIIGADHVPILEYLFDTNPHFEVVKVSSWLISVISF